MSMHNQYINVDINNLRIFNYFNVIAFCVIKHIQAEDYEL